MAAFVALLVVASLTSYLIVFDDVNGYPREETHDYIFEGTLNGEPCSGTGNSVFIEHSGGYMLHALSFSVASRSDALERTIELVFDEDGGMDGSYRSLGTTDIDGRPSSIWGYMSEGIAYTLYTGSDCTLLRVQAESSCLSLTGCIQRHGDDAWPDSN